MSHHRLGLLALLSLGALACSHDDDHHLPPYVSGVASSDAPVSGLSDHDKAQLCQSYGAHVSSSVGLDLIAQAVCLPEAILLGGSPEGCQKRLDACVADVPPPIQVDVSLDDVHVCTDTLAQCNLNVAQLEGCVNLRFDWVYALVSSLSCAHANDDDAQKRAQEMRGVAVCAAGHAGCDRFINVDPVLL
jgi:copper chaperone CopZ